MGHSSATQCLSKCPSVDSYVYDVNNTCVTKAQCTQLKRYLYKDSTGISHCVADCTKTSSPARPYHHDGVCKERCPKDYFGHRGLGQCLKECLINYYGSDHDQSCVNE